MTREIRFRGKRLDNGAWENGRFVVNFGAGDVFEIGECFNKPCEVWSIGNIHDNPELL